MIVAKAYIERGGFQINNLAIHLQKLEKDEQIKSRESSFIQEILKEMITKAEINNRKRKERKLTKPTFGSLKKN